MAEKREVPTDKAGASDKHVVTLGKAPVTSGEKREGGLPCPFTRKHACRRKVKNACFPHEHE